MKPLHFILRVFALFVVILALYVASVGPVVAVAERMKWTPDSGAGEICEVVYRPVTALLVFSPTAEAALVPYLQWWIKFGRAGAKA